MFGCRSLLTATPEMALPMPFGSRTNYNTDSAIVGCGTKAGALWGCPMIPDGGASADISVRLQVAGTINRGRELVSYSRRLIQEAQLRQEAMQSLLGSMHELRGFIRENRRDLNREIKEAGWRAANLRRTRSS